MSLDDAAVPQQHEELDGRMGVASHSLGHQLHGVSVPDFEPSPRRSPYVAVLLVVAGLLGFSLTRDDTVRVQTPANEVVVEETATEPDPDSDSDSEIEGDPIRLTAAGAGEHFLPLASAWNSDGSKILLYRTASDRSGYQLYDAESLSLIGDLDLRPTDIEQLYWDPSNPDDVLYVDGNELTRMNTATQQSNTDYVFGGCVSVTASQSALSWDGDLFAGSCLDESGLATLVSYRFSSGESTDSTFELVGSPLVLASGEGLAVRRKPQAADEGVAWTLLDALHDPTGTEVDSDGSVLWAARASNGDDVLVGASYDGELIGTVVVWDPSTGAGSVLIGPATGFSYPPSGTTISAQSWTAPGQLAIATQGEPEAGESLDESLADAILTLRIDSAGGAAPATIESYRKVTSRNSSPSVAASDYWASSFLSISPDGRTAVYSTDSHTGDRVDTYLVRLTP